MSLPRNNLDEVRRKKTEPLPLSPAPGLLAKVCPFFFFFLAFCQVLKAGQKFTFKPSLSLPRTVSDVAGVQALNLGCVRNLSYF